MPRKKSKLSDDLEQHLKNWMHIYSQTARFSGVFTLCLILFSPLSGAQETIFFTDIVGNESWIFIDEDERSSAENQEGDSREPSFSQNAGAEESEDDSQDDEEDPEPIQRKSRQRRDQEDLEEDPRELPAESDSSEEDDWEDEELSEQTEHRLHQNLFLDGIV